MGNDSNGHNFTIFAKILLILIAKVSLSYNINRMKTINSEERGRNLKLCIIWLNSLDILDAEKKKKLSINLPHKITIN